MAAIIPRLAIGASIDPNNFDGTAILPLCWGDPDLRTDNMSRGTLIRVGLTEYPDPLFTLREIARLDVPRGLRRSGYGVRMHFDVDLIFETTANNYISGQSGWDDSLFALASLFGQTASGTSFGTDVLAPPYLWMTAAYQTEWESWFPIELDVKGQADVTVPYEGGRTWLRRLRISFSTNKTYKKCRIVYYPARTTIQYLASVIFLDPTPGVGPPYNANMILNFLLPANVVPGDAILVRFHSALSGGPYVWCRFVISSIGGSRDHVAVFSQRPWPQLIGFPTTPAADCRTQQADAFYRMPVYLFVPYVLNPPAPFNNNEVFFTNAPMVLPNNCQLIGGSV